MSTSNKINDLSNSEYWKKFNKQDFVPENNISIVNVRVSGRKQDSFEQQLEECQEYVENENLEVVKIWKYKETASKFDQRKNFDSMIETVRISQQTKKPIKHIVFPFQSRSNRNKFSARELEEIVDLNVTLHFARDRRKLSSGSDIGEWVMWHLENAKNISFIEELKVNVMEGTKKVVQNGMYPGAAKFGFVAQGRKENRHFLHNGDKACYMKKAFDLTRIKKDQIGDRKYSDRMLKDDLDQLFPHLDETPDKKRFCELLRDPFYYGDFIYGGLLYKGSPKKIPPLIPKQEWDEVQFILDGRHKSRKLSKAHPYIGMMNCNGELLDENGNTTDQICGCAITAEKIRRHYKNGTKQDFIYYRCSNSKSDQKCSQRDVTYMKEIVGRKVSYDPEEIEVIFQDIFKSFSFDEVTCKRMKQYLWKEHFEHKTQDKSKVETLINRKEQLTQFIEKSYEDKLTGAISEDLWKMNNAKWAKEREKITSELNAIDNSKDEYMQRGVTLIELMQQSENIYKNASPEKKRKLVELVSSNLLLANGTLEYHWRLPFNMLAINGQKGKWHTRQDSNLRPPD